MSLTTAATILCMGAFGAPAGMAATKKKAAPAKPLYPLTLYNCGRRTTYTQAPRRAVSLDQISTEVMLLMNLQKSMVGTAFKLNPIFGGGGGFPSVTAAYATVPVLAEKYPSSEVLLNTSPDFVTGNSDSFTFGPTTNGGSGFTRADLAEKGINTYTFQCPGETATNDLLFKRYVQFGKIFGKGHLAQQLVNKIKRGLASTAAVLRGKKRVRTFYYELGNGPLTTFGGGGQFDFELTLAGGLNIFHDLPSFPTPKVSPESVISRNADVILVVDNGDTTAGSPADKKQFLTSTFGNSVNAVKNNRFCFMEFAGFTTGPRIIATLSKLAPCIHPELKFR